MKFSEKFFWFFLGLSFLSAYVIATQNPLHLNSIPEWQPPSSEYILGVGENGLNLFRAVIEASFQSIILAVCVSFLSIFIGTILSGIMFLLGGRSEKVFGDILNFLDSFPVLIVYLTLGLIVSNNLWGLVLVLSCFSWVHYSRFVRSFLIELRHRDFVTAAKAMGLKPSRIFFKHLLPQFIERFPVMFLVGCRSVVLTESVLSFLGFGMATGDRISLGSLIFTGQRAIFKAPHAVLVPAVSLALLLLILQSLVARFQTLLSAPETS
ncbi:MAG: ABC transporter permease [Proteobacteria bacterium]|nr:ABC transporter permease [Pseudomonadota bacterium]